jgi:hypothetical protein
MMGIVLFVAAFFIVFLVSYLTISIIKWFVNRSKSGEENETNVTREATYIHSEKLNPHRRPLKNSMLAFMITGIILFLGFWENDDIEFVEDTVNEDISVKKDIMSTLDEKSPLTQVTNVHFEFSHLQWEGKTYVNDSLRGTIQENELVQNEISFISKNGLEVAIEHYVDPLFIIEAVPINEEDYIVKTEDGRLIKISRSDSSSVLTQSSTYKAQLLIDQPVRDFAVCIDGIAFTYNDKVLGLYWYSFKQKTISTIETNSAVHALAAKGNTVFYYFNNRFLCTIEVMDTNLENASSIITEKLMTIDFLYASNVDKVKLEIVNDAIILNVGNTIYIRQGKDYEIFEPIYGLDMEIDSNGNVYYISGSLIYEYSIHNKTTHVIGEKHQLVKKIMMGDKIVWFSTTPNANHLGIMEKQSTAHIFDESSDYTLIIDQSAENSILQLYTHNIQRLETLGVGRYIHFEIEETLLSYFVQNNQEDSSIRQGGSIELQKNKKLDYYYPRKD